MKLYINGLYLLAFPLLLAFLACENRPMLDDCFVDTSIIIEPNTLCVDTCTRTFRLRDVEDLPSGVRYNWTLTHNAASVSLDDPAASEITVFLDEGGDYLVSVSLTFDFSGCDETLGRPFTIGVDPPIAAIRVNETECTVGECDLIFTHENENATAWSWCFPDDPNNYRNVDEVPYSFNDFPGTYHVILKAENEGDVIDEDTITITVLPQRFILATDDGQDLSNVLCIQENADGSFKAIGNNGTDSYSFRLNRKGTLISDVVKAQDLSSVYSSARANRCRQVDDTYINVGRALRNNNFDGYAASFNENFVLEAEAPLFSTSNGNEIWRDITARLDGGGYIGCGSNTGVAPVGMWFLETDPSFSFSKDIIHFTGSSSSQAAGIITMDDHYVVTGVASNDGSLEGFYLRLDEDLMIIPGSLNFLGSDFTPTSILKINNDDFVLIGENGNTAIVKLFGSIEKERSIGNTTFNQAIITSDAKLALAGFTGNNNSQKPLLMVLDLPDLQSSIIVNEPYPVPKGEFFCISQTADNGFILGGTLENDNNDELLIIRTDQDGLTQE